MQKGETVESRKRVQIYYYISLYILKQNTIWAKARKAERLNRPSDVKQSNRHLHTVLTESQKGESEFQLSNI